MTWEQVLSAVKEWGLPSALLAMVLWSNARQQQQAATRAAAREQAADDRQQALITRLTQGDGNGGAGLQQLASQTAAMATAQKALGQQVAEQGKEIVSLSHRVCALEETSEQHAEALATLARPAARRRAQA